VEGVRGVRERLLQLHRRRLTSALAHQSIHFVCKSVHLFDFCNCIARHLTSALVHQTIYLFADQSIYVIGRSLGFEVWGDPSDWRFTIQVQGLELRVSGLETWGSGGPGFMVDGTHPLDWFRVEGLGFRGWGSGLRVEGCRLGVCGLWIGISGLGLRV
jgi:hypothetical protein